MAKKVVLENPKIAGVCPELDAFELFDNWLPDETQLLTIS